MLKLKDLLKEAVIHFKDWKAFRPEPGDLFIGTMGDNVYIEVYIVIDSVKSSRFDKEDYICNVKRYSGKPNDVTLKYRSMEKRWLSQLCSTRDTDKRLTKPDHKLDKNLLDIVKLNGNLKLSDLKENKSVIQFPNDYVLEGYVTDESGIITELDFVQELTGEVGLIFEAEYRGRKVKLGKPFRTPGGPKKFSVYVKNPKGNVVKVNFGHKGTGGKKTMKIKKSNAERRKSFRARHRCDTAKDRTTPRYWSCRFGWPKSGKGAIDRT